jgi:hypothetical protein
MPGTYEHRPVRRPVVHREISQREEPQAALEAEEDVVLDDEPEEDDELADEPLEELESEVDFDGAAAEDEVVLERLSVR